MPGTGSVELMIDEPGAAVMVVDNIGRASNHRATEYTLNLSLPRGAYDLQISKQGFLTSHRHVELRPWETKKVTVDLAPRPKPSSQRDLINDLLPGPPEEPDEEVVPPVGDPPDAVGDGGAAIFKGPH